MDRPSIYLSKAFLSKIDEYEPVFRAKRGNPEMGEFIPAELKTLERFVVLLSAGELLTDYDEKEATKLFKKANAGKIPDSFAEMIVHRAIKQDRFHHSTGSFFRYLNDDGSINHLQMVKSTLYKNAVYLLPVDHGYCVEAAQQFGVAAVGANYHFKDFFVACTLSNYATSSALEVVDKIAHKGNGLVIIDKYILTDASKRPDKIPHIIATIMKFMPEKLDMKFELTIITEHIENDKLTEAKSKRILEALGGAEKISFKLIATNYLKESDRFILSNYLAVSVGHPWDRDSVLSSSSTISQDSKEKLQEAFNIWKAKLLLAKEIVANTRPVPNGAFVFDTDGATHKLLNLH